MLEAKPMTGAGDITDLLRAETELETLRVELRNTQRKLASKDRKLAELVEAVIEAARAASLAQPKLPRAVRLATSPGETVHSAILHTTDWQGGKRTIDFDLDVLETRLMKMMDIATVLTKRHANPVGECVLLLGGDMVEGESIFPTQPFEIHAGLYDQWVTVSRLIRRVIDRALTIWPTIRIISKWGNHGRIGRFGELPDVDNIDRMAYRLAWDRYEFDPRVTWDVNNVDYVQLFSIGNYQAALLHGNEFNKSFSAQRITTKVTAWQTIYKFGDVYLGHFHRSDCYGMPNGSKVYLTGSPESNNAYAADQLAAISNPSQRLHFVDPERGRVMAEHTLWLD